jgi:hypothetical protein
MDAAEIEQVMAAINANQGMNLDQLQQVIAAINAGHHAPGAFALTPGTTQPNQPIDYTTSYYLQHYRNLSRTE